MGTKTLTKSGKFENLSELDEEKIKEQHLPQEKIRQPSKYSDVTTIITKLLQLRNYYILIGHYTQH